MPTPSPSRHLESPKPSPSDPRRLQPVPSHLPTPLLSAAKPSQPASSLSSLTAQSSSRSPQVHTSPSCCCRDLCHRRTTNPCFSAAPSVPNSAPQSDAASPISAMKNPSCAVGSSLPSPLLPPPPTEERNGKDER
ncbi:hypothetical protein M0R45_009100 [Rubus argutus]|uniref:Uncharacterized protein n=1 Tax=Rubus argutus TaxID=59490 RepID=A0AAW1Y307_RUBAR